MAAPPNVELEAAKFLHKLIQESKDEPTKLATKLYVILQHMRSSGKENSMPYQVISRAMETVINQHGLDIEALMSSRHPLTAGTQLGDSASSQFGGSSLRGAVSNETNVNVASSELNKVDSYASNRPPAGPSSGSHDIYHGSTSHLNSKSLDHESPSSFDTRPSNSHSEERRDSPNWEKVSKKDNKKGISKRKRADPSQTGERQFGDLQPLDPSAYSSGMDKSGTKIDQSRNLSIQSGEFGQFSNMIQSNSSMEHSAIRSVLRAKQETQHQSEKSIDSTNISNSLSRAPQSRYPEEIEVSSSHNGLSRQQGGSLPSTHDVMNSRGLWNLNKIGPPLEQPEVSRFSFRAGAGNPTTETLMHQSAASSLGLSAAGKAYGSASGASGMYTAAEPGNPSAAPFTSPYDNPPSDKGTVGKALEHEGGIFHSSANANYVVQGGMLNNVAESMIPRSTGKSPVPQAPVASSMPFKEQHLKQLRAQCLVHLAFRNGMMPKKLHLEIALGNFFPREEGPSKEMTDQKAKEQSNDGPSNSPDTTMPFGRLDNPRENERSRLGPSSIGNLSKEGDSMNMIGEKNHVPSGLPENGEESRQILGTRRKPENEMQYQEISQSQLSSMQGGQQDGFSARGSAVNSQKDNLDIMHRPIGSTNLHSSVMGMSQQMKAEMTGWTGNRCDDETSKASLLRSAVLQESRLEGKDDAPNQLISLGDRNFQGSRHADVQLPNFPVREHWKPLSQLDGGNHSVALDDTQIAHKDLEGSKLIPLDNALQNGNSFTVVETDHEEEDNSINLQPSPKYTTLEKWIIDHQERILLREQTWVLKKQKTQQRITACSDKLKANVSASEDISAKTRSVIELKKLQLLELQSRLRNDILNDFFKPISSEMDRLKSIKKHRIGRRSKQLEKYEQKMKEERQKRFRERQKEFFTEIEVHKERLEDVFKMRRERWKGFNKYVREFHKRKERVHREKIDRIQREKINLLKINDVEGYLRMVQDAKSDRVKQLLKETEKYLQKLGSKLQDAKAMSRCFQTEMDDNRIAGVMEKNEITIENEDETDQAKHYLESNEKYYLMAHSIKENVAEQPSCLVGGKLREYQMNGLRWLVSLYNNHLNGILADEMGLGKTVQVISLICYLMETKNDRGPFLVVVPSSVLPGWDSEINFWAPSINKIVYCGPPEERRRLFKERIVPQKFNVLLTTYEYLMNKHDRPKLSKVHWHYVIIDEGHRIKNASCKLNADLKLYRSSHRLLLTGTPLQNNLEELWALLNFLLPNIFNSSEDFSQWFNKPFESNGDSSPDEALLSEEENLLIINRLHQVLRPFVLRRLKHKVENELPEKIERLVRCEASSYQKLLMKRVEENLGALGTSKARSVHNSVMELRNICNHPYLSQLHVEEVHDYIPKHYLPNIVRLCGKLEMLDRILPKLVATDHRVLLFSTMTRLLDVMEDYLYWKQYKYLRLDGHTSGGDRGALIDQFNRPGSPYFIFLLSIRAGGVGVNLQAADTVIIFDTDWNPQVDLQAQARAHRIGQKREVLVLRFETVQTVEEQVRAAAEHKLGVANQSITAGFFDNNTSAEDRREYLESLLRECKKEEAAPVLHDDALNDLIARSESEIDIFESIDRRRQEEEMAAWKLFLGQGANCSDPVVSLPSRLLTAEELKPFCEAMKISDSPAPVVVSNSGVKRKSEYLGGLDTQHYGRGKRAREVRSYEEQWTEDEFEKMCQVESPHSPKMKDEGLEMNLPMVANESPKITVKTEGMVPPVQPIQPPIQQPVQPPLEHSAPLVQSTHPPLVLSAKPLVQSTQPSIVQSIQQQVQPPLPQVAQYPLPQAVHPPLPQPTLQSKEATPKRGRGRPKRVTTQISPSQMVVPANSGAGNMDVGSQIRTVSTSLVEPLPHVLPSSTIVTTATVSNHQFGVLVSPGIQGTANLPAASTGNQSTSITYPAPVADKRRGRRLQSGGGEAPKRRGRKPNTVVSATPVLPAPSGTDNSAMVTVVSATPVLPAPSGTDNSAMFLQGNNVSGFPVASGPDTTHASVPATDVGKETSTPLLAPVLASSSGAIKSHDAPVSAFPVFQNSSLPIGTNVTKHDLSGGTANSQAVLPLLPVSSDSQSTNVGKDATPQPKPSVMSAPLGPQSVPPSQSVAKQVKGRGRKAQSELEPPRRRGRKQNVASTAIPDTAGGQEPTSIEPPQKKPRATSSSKVIGTRSKQQSEAQKLVNAIQAESGTVITSGKSVGVDSVSTENLCHSADNNQGVSSSVITDEVSRSSHEESANINLNQPDAPVSGVGSLSGNVEACKSIPDLTGVEVCNSVVKDVAPETEVVTGEAQSSEPNINQSSKPSFLGMSETQNSGNTTCSALSTSSASNSDLPTSMRGAETGKEIAEKLEKKMIPFGDIVAPNSEVENLESKISIVALDSVTTESKKVIGLRSAECNLIGPASANQHLEEGKCSDLSPSQTMAVNHCSDNKTNSASILLESDPVSDVDKAGTPSEKDGQKVVDLIRLLPDHFVAPSSAVLKPESPRNAVNFTPNVADPDNIIEEPSRLNDDNPPTVHNVVEKSADAKHCVVKITSQAESVAEESLVAVNDSMMENRGGVISYEGKVATDGKGQDVGSSAVKYTSDKGGGVTNVVASNADGSVGFLGEKSIVLKDDMMAEGSIPKENAVNAVAEPEDKAEVVMEFEGKELLESKKSCVVKITSQAESVAEESLVAANDSIVENRGGVISYEGKVATDGKGQDDVGSSEVEYTSDKEAGVTNVVTSNAEGSVGLLGEKSVVLKDHMMAEGSIPEENAVNAVAEADDKAEVGMKFEGKELAESKKSCVVKITSQAEGVAEENLVAVNNSIVENRGGVISYEGKVATDGKVQDDVGSSEVEYTSDNEACVTNVVASNADGSVELLGEKAVVLKDHMMAEGSIPEENAVAEAENKAEVRMEFEGKELPEAKKSCVVTITSQAEGVAEENLVAVNNSIVEIRGGVISYEGKVATDGKGQDDVGSSEVEYSSDKEAGVTNVVTSNAEGSVGLLGEKSVVLKDHMMAERSIPEENAVNAVAEADDKAEVGMKFEGKELAESKGRIGFVETREGNHDITAVEGTTDVGERKSFEELKEVIRVATEHESHDQPGTRKVHAFEETTIHQPLMELSDEEQNSQVDKGICAEIAEYNKKGGLKSEPQVQLDEERVLETTKENYDVAAGGSIDGEETKSCEKFEEAYRGVPDEDKEKEQQGNEAAPAIKIPTVEIRHERAMEELLVGQYSAQAGEDFGEAIAEKREHEGAAICTGEDEFVAEQSQPFVDEARPIEKVEESEGTIQHERMEHEGDGEFHAIGQCLANVQTTEERNIEQCRTQTEAKPDEKVEVTVATEPEACELEEAGLCNIKEKVVRTGLVKEHHIEQFQNHTEQVDPSEKVEDSVNDRTKEHEGGAQHPSAESTTECGKTSGELNELCRTEAREAKADEKVDAIQEASEHEKTNHQEDGESHFIVKSDYEIRPTTDQLLVEPYLRLVEQAKPSEIVEDVQASAEIATEIGQRLEEPPVEQYHTPLGEESVSFEEVEEVLHADKETTVEIGQMLEKLPVEEPQTQVKEDFESSGNVEARDVGAKITEEVQGLKELTVERCQTREEDLGPSAKVEEVSVASAHDKIGGDSVQEAGMENPILVGQNLKKLSVQQCQTQVKEVELIGRVEVFQEATEGARSEQKEGEVLHSILETETETSLTIEEFPSEHCQTQAEETKPSAEIQDVPLGEIAHDSKMQQGGGVLHDGVETTVQIEQDELPVEQSEIQTNEDSQPFGEVEVILQKETEQERKEELVGKLPQTIEETADVISQRTEQNVQHAETPEKNEVNRSEKMPAIHNATEHERSEQGGDVSHTPSETTPAHKDHDAE